MPINWASYEQNVLDTMDDLANDKRPYNLKIPLPPQMQQRRIDSAYKLARAIVNGYIDAMSGGGDPLLKASVILNIAGTATFMSGVIAALSTTAPPSPPMLHMAINIGVVACWTGATLDASSCAPLPGHIGHSPVSTVLVPGVMAMLPPVGSNGTQTQFVTNMINAMKAHCLLVGGMHPVMLLPAPAPPYPLPWLTYQ